eukprot:gene7303-11622_t
MSRSPRSPKSPVDSTKKKKRLSFDFIFLSGSEDVPQNSPISNLAQQKAKQAAETTVKQKKENSGTMFNSVSNPNSSMFQPPKQPPFRARNLQDKLESTIQGFNIQNVLQNVSVQINPENTNEPEKKINDHFMMKNIITQLKTIEDEEDNNEPNNHLETCYDLETHTQQSTDNFMSTNDSYHAGSAVNSIMEGISSNSMDFTLDDSNNIIELEGDAKKESSDLFSSLVSLDSQNKDHSFGSTIENHLVSHGLIENQSLVLTDDSFHITE